jgi:predicted metal-dependent enzyme (double-stranded beta helix superfamily)
MNDSGSEFLKEAAELVGPEPVTAARLSLAAAWLGGAANALDLTAARAEVARTGRSAVVAYRPGGPILGVSWFPPGLSTDVHSHGGWGVIHVLDGTDRYERFARVDDAEPVEVRELVAGDTLCWSDPPGDVHRQTGTGDGAVELVLLARDGRSLPERAARCLQDMAYDSLAQLYAPDVVCDADVPHHRFQLHGRDEILDVLRKEELALPAVRVTSFRWAATVDGGLVAQREARFDGAGGEHLWRDVHVLRVTDGWITEHSISCTGIWDPATIAGHASGAAELVTQ